MPEAENVQMKYEGKAVADGTSIEFSGLAEALIRQKKMGKTIIGVLDDRAFDGKEIPADLSLKHITDTWGQDPDISLTPLDANQIRSYSIIYKAAVDILVFPYGSIFPMDAYPLFSAQWLMYFIEKGGSVLTSGGIPFISQAHNNGSVIATEDAESLLSAYDKWGGKFGVKFYPRTAACDYEVFDNEFLPSLKNFKATPPQFGIVVNNSSHYPVPVPSNGNVFPERYPAKQVIPLSWSEDKYGQIVAVTGILTQDYETGSTRIHFSHENKQHPLSPSNPDFTQTMDELKYLLLNKIIAGEIECKYACYK